MTEAQLIRQIAMRASQMHLRINREVVNPAFFENELRIVHHEIVTMRLEDLFKSDDGNFAHDIAGIHNHLDILNASFRNNFWPRFAEK